jgi:hypothetical protein
VNIYFDVDYTLIDGDGDLRPGVREAFELLAGDGHLLFLWSGLGPRWDTVERHDLGRWVQDCFDKPLYRHREMLQPLGISAAPDYVVDDHPHLPHVFGGCVVMPYRDPDPADQEMKRVVREVGLFRGRQP